MEILICSGFGEPHYTTSKSLISAFKSIPSVNVTTCGPMYGDEKDAPDIVLEDKPFPEMYCYAEVLDHCTKKPNLIIQVEPHFYLYDKRKTDPISVCWVLDTHRGAKHLIELPKLGSFDYLFVAHKYYIPLFQDADLNAYWLPQAFNDKYIPSDLMHMSECDIVFIGETGINDFESNLDHEDDIGMYANKIVKHKDDFFKFGFNQSYEYAERAEMLYRLCNDFDVRIYSKITDESYAKVLKQGRIVFNRSLGNDINIRCYEAMASNRLLVTNDIYSQNELFQDRIHCRTYRTYFSPLFSNFDVEYLKVYKIMQYYLTFKEELYSIAQQGYDHIRRYHTFKERAKEILNIVYS